MQGKARCSPMEESRLFTFRWNPVKRAATVRDNHVQGAWLVYSGMVWGLKLSFVLFILRREVLRPRPEALGSQAVRRERRLRGGIRSHEQGEHHARVETRQAGLGKGLRQQLRVI